MNVLLRKAMKTMLKKAGLKVIRVHPHDNVEPELKVGPKLVVPTKVIVGGGDYFYGADWHNIEYVTKGYSDKYSSLPRNIDISLDLSASPKFPIADDSLEAVYTSHVIEHLEDAHVLNVFKNAHRTLKIGGYLRISCPDIDLYLRALKDNDLDFFHYRHVAYYQEAKISDSLPGLFLDVFTRQANKNVTRDHLMSLFNKLGPVDALNELKSSESYDPMYSHHHINWFNLDKLQNMLRESGFNLIYRSGKGQSFSPSMRNMNVFDTGDPKISLFVEAQKTL